MEENGCMIRNRSKDYKNGERSANKAIVNCKIAPVDHHAHGCRENTNITSNHQDSFGIGGKDLVSEFSWPPRFYTCTFCKREFRSAQALGGHMNVHRREKARLRQITPQRYNLPFLPPPPHQFTYNSTFLALNPNPNPNPNISTCLSSSPYRLSTSDSANFATMRSQKPDVTIDGSEEFSHQKEYMILKKSEKGLLVDPRFSDLDLELRLGCS